MSWADRHSKRGTLLLFYVSVTHTITLHLTTHFYKNEQQYSSKQCLREWIYFFFIFVLQLCHHPILNALTVLNIRYMSSVMCRYWLLLSNIKMIIKHTHTWEGRDYGEMLPVLLWNLFLRTNNATGRTSRMKPSTPSIAQCLQSIPWQLSGGDIRTVGENDPVLLLGLQSH